MNNQIIHQISLNQCGRRVETFAVKIDGKPAAVFNEYATARAFIENLNKDNQQTILVIENTINNKKEVK